MTLCIISEGTYPYHVGGVSTWTHALLEALPEVSIVLVPLYAGEDPGPPTWSLPSNVATVRPLQVPDSLAPADVVPWCNRVAPSLPPVDLVHSLTAGVAGRLGRALQAARNCPFLVTEHGVGWHELQQGAAETETGIRPAANARSCFAQQAVEQSVHHLRRHARAVYAAADRIAAVAWSTQQKQYALGADPARCQVLPNGVLVPDLPPDPPRNSSFHVGLVGRVTPLKDIKTFLRTCAQVQAAHPGARFSVVGPPSDASYATQCHTLADTLGLTDALTFVEDARAMTPWYERFNAVALTSKSEAQPLALLEAMAHARPVVTTDVGDCRRLVTGPDDDVGPAGRVCPVGDAEEVGDALLALAHSPARQHREGRSGWRRVRSHYRRDQMTGAYRRLYADLSSTDRLFVTTA